MKKQESQLKKVLEYMKSGNAITSLEAFRNWNITRLSSIIHILRHKFKLNITSEMNNGYASYKLVEE